jgi:hypothetical protein
VLKNIMDRLTHSTGRPKHLEQNLNSLDVVTRNNNSTSASQEKITLPTLRNIAEKNGIKLYPFIQKNEYKYKNLLNSSETDSSSIVESSSSSDEEVNGGLKKAASEITLSSRPSSTQKKDSSTASEVQSTSFFEHMPEDVIRKILFENVIDLNDIPKSAKNLLQFASTSKFNREFVRQLLTEEGAQEISFEITKSFVPNLLATLENDKKSQFTQADLDLLVHNNPYLTFDCSYVISKENFTNQGLQVLKKIVCHPDLRGVRIISNPRAQISERNDKYVAYNNIGLELLYSLLSRESATPLKVDFILNNCEPPIDTKFRINENSFELIKKIQNRADRCESVIFGKMDLSRSKFMLYEDFDVFGDSSINNRDYQFKYIKMMCNIALTHSAHTISLVDLMLLDSELVLIFDEIMLCDKSSLQHLDLGRNEIDASAAESLGVLLQSESASLKILNLDGVYLSGEGLNILAEALKTNLSSELIVILTALDRNVDHPIRNDKRVRLT